LPTKPDKHASGQQLKKSGRGWLHTTLWQMPLRVQCLRAPYIWSQICLKNIDLLLLSGLIPNKSC
jgi:hypothetical protein